MRVLIACEFSGVVREAFIKRGHDAVSCDLLPTEISGPHIQDDITNALKMHYYNDDHLRWDLMVAFPPCTHLAVSGAKWFKYKVEEQKEAMEFFMSLVNTNITKIAIENPIGIMSTQYRKPDQIIQPWQYGHGETKATCLWLKNLPKLEPTNIVEGREHRIHKMAPGPNRARERSRTYQGIANAMAEQWS